MLYDFQISQQYLSTTVENRATLEKKRTAIYRVFGAQATKLEEGRRILGSYQRTSNLRRISTTPAHGSIAS
jgi:hypothetical protein